MISSGIKPNPVPEIWFKRFTTCVGVAYAFYALIRIAYLPDILMGRISCQKCLLITFGMITLYGAVFGVAHGFALRALMHYGMSFKKGIPVVLVGTPVVICLTWFYILHWGWTWPQLSCPR